MKKQMVVRSRQTEGSTVKEALPLLMVISILAIVFITVFNAV